MATIIQEFNNDNGREKNLVRLFMWLLIVAVIGTASYYIFFAQPQLVEVAVPPNFKSIDPLSTITLDPQAVINSPAFQALKNYVPPLPPATTGRSNPFAP